MVFDYQIYRLKDPLPEEEPGNGVGGLIPPPLPGQAAFVEAPLETPSRCHGDWQETRLLVDRLEPRAMH